MDLIRTLNSDVGGIFVNNGTKLVITHDDDLFPDELGKSSNPAFKFTTIYYVRDTNAVGDIKARSFLFPDGNASFVVVDNNLKATSSHIELVLTEQPMGSDSETTILWGDEITEHFDMNTSQRMYVNGRQICDHLPCGLFFEYNDGDMIISRGWSSRSIMRELVNAARNMRPS